MIKKILYLTLCCFVFLKTEAQQLPQYTQYMLNEMAINPATAGKDEFTDVRSNNRYQWIGITDAPRTYMLTLSSPFKNRHHGWGTQVYTDIVGPTRRVGVKFSYAYHVKLAKKTMMSLGLSAGIQQWGIDGSKITLHDAGDEYLLTQYQTKLLPDFGAGIYIHNDKWYLGVSLPQIYQSPIKLYSADNQANLVTHFLVNGAYKINVGDKFKVEPSFILKYANPAPVMIDGGLRVIFKDQIWIGSTYRHHDAVSALIGFMYKNYLSIGYSYDFTTSNLKKYSTGTHELMLGLRFSKAQAKTWKED